MVASTWKGRDNYTLKTVISIWCCAYRYQANDPCSYERGTCLNNQLQHLFDEDMTRRSSGQDPLYLGSRFAQVGGAMIKWWYGAGPYVKLKYTVPSIRTSMYKVDIAADNINMVTKYAPGQVWCPVSVLQ